MNSSYEKVSIFTPRYHVFMFKSQSGNVAVPEWECRSPGMGLIFAAVVWSVCDNGRLSLDKVRVLKNNRQLLRNLPFVSEKVPV